MHYLTLTNGGNMSLADFEARMLKLKGVKLPAVSVTGTEVSKYANSTVEVTPNPLVNKILNTIEEDKINDVIHNPVLDDILMGIVRSFDVAKSHKGHKLNAAVVRSILHNLPIISTKSIMDNFGYSRSQAKHYAYACRLVIQFKGRDDVKEFFNKLRYYDVTN